MRRVAGLVLAAVLVGACGGDPAAAPPSATAAPATAATTATTAATAAPATAPATATTTAATTTTDPTAPRWFRRILVVVMENAGLDAVLRNADFAALAARGTRYAGSRAVAHPSEPNYLAMVGGDTFVSDDGAHDLSATNVVDLLEAKGVTWKAYLEGFPGGCSPTVQATGADGSHYVRKHDPFVSFDDVRTDPARCAHLVDGTAFAADLAAGSLPQYGFYVPDLVHDGHDSSVAVAGAWLDGFLAPLLDDPRAMDGTLVVITYDESTGGADPGSQPIFTLAIGAGAAPGTVDATPVDHYGLLRTVEDNWHLGTLGREDDRAVPLPLAAAGT